MARKPLAMKTLIAELTKSFEDAAFEIDEVDGLGAARRLIVGLGDEHDLTESIAFLLEQDERVAEAAAFDGDHDYDLTVLFVGDNRADDHRPFGVAGMLDVTQAVEVEYQAEVVGDNLTHQQLYTAEELKGKRTNTLVDLVTTEDPSEWSREELLSFLQTGVSPEDLPVVDDDADEQ